MNDLLIKRIDDFLSREENDIFKGVAADLQDVLQAENDLNVTFDKDYVQFLMLFGGSFVGLPIYGFKNSEMLSEQTVVDLTQEFRADYASENRFNEIQKSYVISIEGNGDPMIIDSKGEVLIYNHDNDMFEHVASSFEKLIEDNLP